MGSRTNTQLKLDCQPQSSSNREQIMLLRLREPPSFIDMIAFVAKKQVPMQKMTLISENFSWNLWNVPKMQPVKLT